MTKLNFETDGKDWPNREASRFIKAAGFSWHVQVFGQGPQMLLLHGTGASTHSWRHIAPFLSVNYTLIIPDLPGHGFTDDPPSNAFTLPGMASAVGELLNQLNLKPVTIAGHSAGAAVAIRMTLDGYAAPSHIISINGALKPFGGAAAEFFSPLAKVLFLNPFMPRFFAWRANDKAAVERILKGTGATVSDEDIKFYGRLFATPNHCAAALAMMARWDLPSLIRDIPRLKVPLLLLAGEKDLAVPPRDAANVAALLSSAQSNIVPGAGHLAHEEKPEIVARLIADFIAQHANHPAAAQ